ncbi:hypothetical protein LCGC14_0783580 [marine sediment metagenome]|uniref:Uncharacterized protein n=1 Tax=marine sediment metagenome TaxID=412755 RepID=A0A0F9PV09_9ZZZZ
MKKIRYVFYMPVWRKGQWKDNFIGYGIAIWTFALNCWKPKMWKYIRKHFFSHVEMWFPDEDGKFITMTPEIDLEPFAINSVPQFTGQCFSSTMRDAQGVRFALASEVLRNPRRWWYIEATVTDTRYELMLLLAKRQEGKPYDKWGLFTGFFMLAPYLQNDDERYCSDVCAWLAWMANILPKRLWIISPRRFAWLLVKNLNRELKPLVKGKYNGKIQKHSRISRCVQIR